MPCSREEMRELILRTAAEVKALGFRYASDTRGTHPFIPVVRAEIVGCPQFPTTLPTLDELIGRGAGQVADQVGGEPEATVVGVLEPSVPYPEETQVIANVVTSPHHLGATMTTDREHRMTELFGRLKPDAASDRSLSSATPAWPCSSSVPSWL